MATASVARVLPLGSVTIYHIVDGIDQVLATIRRSLSARRTAAVLSKLTDAQLEDIGVRRGEVRRVALRVVRA
jgi:uncharacterized protein YjiS (DUF1127 family)